MSIGSWDPSLGSQSSDLTLDGALLEKLSGYSREEQLEELDSVLSAEDKQQLAGIMQLDHDQWRAAAEPQDSAAIRHLIRLLAVAENLPGWEAGAASPVIPLAKVLRERGARLDKTELLWLREVSENRFLPYGPL